MLIRARQVCDACVRRGRTSQTLVKFLEDRQSSKTLLNPRGMTHASHVRKTKEYSFPHLAAVLRRDQETNYRALRRRDNQSVNRVLAIPEREPAACPASR